MSEPTTSPATAPLDAPIAGDAHHTDEHDGATGHDAPDHHEDPLGPIDWRAWGAGALGVVLGLAVVVVFARSTGLLGS